jgi:YegS/Rv2252/BmrU family lipid kinase
LKKTLFIINPSAASGLALKTWSKARPELIRLGVELIEQVTTRAGETTELVRNALAVGITRIVAVGGDGTLNEVVNGYLDSTGRPINSAAVLGLLPGGTGSDFRRSLGLATEKDALHSITRSEVISVDAVRAEFQDASGATRSRFFINAASLGMGGKVAGSVNRWNRWWPRWLSGRVRFMLAAVLALRKYKNIPTRLLLDGERQLHINSNLVVVANGRFAGGGMMLAPNAELNDGLLDVVLTDCAGRIDVLKGLPRIYSGNHPKNPKVKQARARTVLIETAEPLPLELDGELVGHTPALLTILPSAVKFAAVHKNSV